MKTLVVAFIAALCALAGPAAAQDVSQQQSSLAAFQQGLARQMRQTAQHLRAGDRYQAMQSLNQARHLDKALANAAALPNEAARAFQAAQDGVDRARSLVQNGAPERAAPALDKAAGELEGASLGAPSAPDNAQLGRAHGRTAIDANGKVLGGVRALSIKEGSIEARVSSGGFLGIGASEHTTPVTGVVVGSPYVALATPST